ncbi:hypothetical protein QI330_11925 [Staphylococcus saprophyticus]|jgi:hypothetical protein|uniref:hypothetical protein n=1 Tax=Staphylococcus TaxID=1279 RepID=UPI0008529F44|nr:MULTISPECIES: hypothetical protein [Staphylococcus]MDW3782995.1 hypothetical protein [Staphylococcus saprophyticus]MDW3919974.1 hypothetical protein [Staphylococcus saprophyticus]MDW3938094.1 hypothetical protein [Staphylococcus saprophyticus]MDW3943241.1 hypothetical protein [Staphylococcus saprophyticus]MDW3953452.1 hypothetical protein [Staphylococcus saprophyticus]
MKDKKLIIMISSILGVMLLLFMVFEVATMFNSTLTESSNRSLEISIALFAMFATFGGAYFGAKISGETASKNTKIQIDNQLNENRKIEKFNRQRLKAEIKNNMLKEYLHEINTYNSILQNIEVLIKRYINFTIQFGESYKYISDEDYEIGNSKRVNDFHFIIQEHLKIEEQRNNVMDQSKVNNFEEEVPNITINMLEPIVNIENERIIDEIYSKLNSYLVRVDDIDSGLKEFLISYKWIDRERKQVIDEIKNNISNLEEM